MFLVGWSIKAKVQPCYRAWPLVRSVRLPVEEPVRRVVIKHQGRETVRVLSVSRHQ